VDRTIVGGSSDMNEPSPSDSLDDGDGVRRRAVRIDIDASALRHNLSLVRRRAGKARVFAVVKADAYGHGAVTVARALDDADGFAVVTCDEAAALRRAGEKRPILVMQGVRDTADASTCRDLSLWPAVHHDSQMSHLALGDGRVQAWLKVDTGMGRLGVPPGQVTHLLANTAVEWIGVMSHFACADAPGNAHTLEQIARFDALVLPHELDLSLGNSAAISAWPAVSRQWVRPGLMLYGANPLDGEAMPPDMPLRPVMRVSAPLISVKPMPAGTGIGYAQAYRCPEAMPVGFAAIGYADGLPRVLDERADVLLHGARCPIIGRVSMDSIAIDLRRASQASVGDRVMLWGPGQPVERLAASAGTIAYELLTGIRGHRGPA